jgi:pyruvate dehydrogenase E2 component (dihydrolipoamide acetyltransferase)
MWLDMTKADQLLAELSESHDCKVTYAALVGKAASLALSEMPAVNAKVIGRKIYRKKTIDVYYQVDIGKGSDLTGTVVTNTDEKPLHAIALELSSRAKKIRRGEDRQYEKTQKRGLFRRAPIWLLAYLFRMMSFLLYRVGLPSKLLGASEPDPFGSVMVTNVGSFGIDVAYAPLVPWTRTPYIFLVGRARQMPVVVDGELVVRKMLPVSATIDHRVIDGALIGRMSQIIKRYLENPNDEGTLTVEASEAY